MRTVPYVLAAIAVLAANLSCAFGDGGVYPPVAEAKVTIPSQEALIHYADGVETLVVETRFVGSGKEFAWVVPVPSEPQVFPATTGLFPTLRWLTRREVIHNVPHIYLVVAIWVVVCYLLLKRKYLLLALLGVAGLLYIALTPALGGAGSMPQSAESDVQVLERQVVGVFDTATIASKDPDALLRWLSANGFAAPPGIRPAVAQYVSEGWLFVAARIRRDDKTDGVVTPHPLGFRFKTDKPVYPLRLTGIDNGPCSIDLYVFGPGDASAPGFSTARCYRPQYPKMPDDETGGGGYWKDTDVVVHPMLRKIVQGAPVATKLSATLAPADMSRDAYLSWGDFTETRPKVFSSYAMAVISADIGVSLMMVGLAIVAGLNYGRRTRHAASRKILLGSFILSVVSIATCWLVLPHTQVHLAVMPYLRTQTQLCGLGMALEVAQVEAPPGTIIDAKWVRARLANGVQEKLFPEKYKWSVLTGDPLREEDSPGNYTIRETAQTVDYLWYDGAGEPRLQTVLDRTSVPATAPSTQPSVSNPAASTTGPEAHHNE